jgi:hypothetical protein
VKVTLYVEGGGNDSKLLRTLCRRGFKELLAKCGFESKMPQIVACGPRNNAFKLFCTAHAQAQSDEVVLLLVDSEDQLQNIHEAWAHLKARDQWQPPPEATDNQVLLMVTCMETWLVTDRQALQLFYGHCLRESALPSLHNLEGRTRQAVQTALARATAKCERNEYQKGAHSFKLLAALTPATLMRHLPSFERMVNLVSHWLNQPERDR